MVEKISVNDPDRQKKLYKRYKVIDKTCINCKKSFKSNSYSVKKEGGGFCSRRCSLIYNRPKKKTPEEVFLSKVKIYTNTDGCWNYGHSNKRWNYGQIRVGNKNKRASRFSYEFYNGKIEGKLNVLHKCDNPACVNPKHLFLGTIKDNVDDMMKKRRGNFCKGENQFKSKLKNENIIEIRERIKSGEILMKIAKDYNVSYDTIYSIKRGKTWKHLL